ncbi:50S ribosomal protein L4 [Patescibacteria group bacterium]|nr:50S ribosomal protein L4 [Patescibacteria group bacterium]
MEATLYTPKGAEAKKITIPEAVFGLKWNADLVHQVVVSMNSIARNNVAYTKNRGQVSGGGKKPWQQKGTGRARHGSIRSPIWVGGGVTHGPNNLKNFDRKINKKMKAKALYTILSAKYKKGEVLFVNDLTLRVIKTKDAKDVLSSLSGVSGFKDLMNKRKNSAYIALSTKDTTTEKSFRNLGNVVVDEIRNMSPLDLMKYKYVVISNPEQGLSQISEKLGSKKVGVEKKVTKTAKATK